MNQKMRDEISKAMSEYAVRLAGRLAEQNGETVFGTDQDKLDILTLMTVVSGVQNSMAYFAMKRISKKFGVVENSDY